MASKGGWDINIDDMDIPYYGRLSHPISPIPAKGAAANVATGAALKGIAEVGADTATFGMKLAERGVEEQTRSQMEPLVQQHIKDLEGVRDAVYGQKSQDTNPSLLQGGASTVTPSGGGDQPDVENLPPGLQRGLDKFQNLANARNQGKFKTDTQFKGEVDRLASDLRNQYTLPAFRRVIDSTTARITGIPHTANAYINALTSDIDKATAAHSATQNKIETHALSVITSGLVNPQPVINAYMRWRQDGNDAELLSVLGKVTSDKASTERRMQEIALSKADDSEKSRMAQKTMSEAATQEGTNQTVDLIKSLRQFGLTDEIAKDSASTAKWLTSLSQDQRDAVHAAITARKATAQNALWNMFTSPGKNGAPSLFERSGWDMEAVKKGMEPGFQFFNTLETFLNNKDVSPIVAQKNLIESIQQQHTLDVMTKLGPVSEQLLDIHSIGTITQSPATGLILYPTITEKMGPALEQLHKQQRVRAIAHPGTRTLKEDSQEATRIGKEEGYAESQVTPVVNQKVEDSVDLITNPVYDINMRKGAVDYYFGANNAGFITGTGRNGQKYWDTLTQPKVLKTIHDQMPDKWDMVKDRVQSTFTSEIAIPAVKRMSSLASRPDIHITFDDANKTEPFNYDTGNLKSVHGRRNVADPYGADIDSMNNAYRSAVSVAEAEGREPKEYFFSVMHQLHAPDLTGGMTTGDVVSQNAAEVGAAFTKVGKFFMDAIAKSSAAAPAEKKAAGKKKPTENKEE